MKRFLLIVIVWVALAWVNAGFILAEAQRRDLQGARDQEWHANYYRSDLGFACGWSLLFGPIAWVITPFLTGFYEHGWMAPVLHPSPHRGTH